MLSWPSPAAPRSTVRAGGGRQDQGDDRQREHRGLRAGPGRVEVLLRVA